MADFSIEHFLELKELFIGGELQLSPKSWIIPTTEPFLDILGDGITYENDVPRLDLGSISPFERKQISLYVTNLTQNLIFVWVKETSASISARWEGNYCEMVIPPSEKGAKLNVIFNGHGIEEEVIDTCVCLIAEMESGSSKEINIPVHIQTDFNFPYGQYDFNGTSHLTPYDFGRLDPVSEDSTAVTSYRLCIENIGKKNLIFSLDFLPGWMNAVVNNQSFSGAVKEYAIAPETKTIVAFQPSMSPDFLGYQENRVIFESNDMRPSQRELNFQFSVTREIEGSHVTLESPVHLEALLGELQEFLIPLLNLGNKPASVSLERPMGPFCAKEKILIPAADGGEAQRKDLAATIDCRNFSPGKHSLVLELSVGDEEREPLLIPLNLLIVGIEAEPGEIDFGMVDGKGEHRRIVCFKSTDGRGLNIMARPFPHVKEYLKVSVIDTDSIEVSLREKQTSSDSSPYAYEGPGVEVYELDTNYRSTLLVSFHFEQPHTVGTPPNIAGILCENCHLVSESEMLFCSECGMDLNDAPEVTEEMVVQCSVCRRKYDRGLKLCPVDKEPLN